MAGVEIKPLDKATFNLYKKRTIRPENAEYWIDRAFRAEDISDKTSDELLRDMRKVYQNSLAELEKEIQAFYGRYAEENGLTMQEVHKRLDPKQLKSAQEEIKRYYEFADPKKIGKNMSDEYRDELRRLSARAYMSRLEEIKMKLKNLVIRLAAEENERFEKSLKKTYAEVHSQSSFTIDKGLGFSEGYSAPDDDVLTKAVSEKWLGSNYSDRIWQDKGKLLTAIENNLLSGIAQGHNPRKIAEAMAKTYGSDYKNCERLARTETIHIMNSATYDSYKEHGIEKYRFVCGLDERTCPTCGALDGTVHDMKYAEEGINYPVMHPNCYDEETEVLTKDGWKLFKDCTDDDEYFSVNPKNLKKTEYIKPLKRISYLHVGKMLKFSHRDRFSGIEEICLRITENHNMFLQTSKTVRIFKRFFHLFKRPKIYTADEVFRHFTNDNLNFYFVSEKGNRIHVNVAGTDYAKREMVYCVELPKWHTLLVRRNGSTPVWCGNCRCTTVPEFDDEISKLFDDEEDTRLAYDEERKHYDVPADMTYKEWREMVSEKKTG